MEKREGKKKDKGVKEVAHDQGALGYLFEALAGFLRGNHIKEKEKNG